MKQNKDDGDDDNDDDDDDDDDYDGAPGHTLNDVLICRDYKNHINVKTKQNIWQYVFMSLQSKWVHSIVPGIWPRMLITRILQHRGMYYRMWALKREIKTTTTTKDNMFIFGNV